MFYRHHHTYKKLFGYDDTAIVCLFTAGLSHLTWPSLTLLGLGEAAHLSVQQVRPAVPTHTQREISYMAAEHPDRGP